MNAAVAVTVDDSSSLKWASSFHAYPEASRPRPIRLGWQRVPPWANVVIPRLVELGALPSVDPRGSRPLDTDDVIEALNFLSRVMRDDTMPPWIGRLSTGGVQLTWRSDDVEVEAVFDRARDERDLMVTVGENEWDAPAAEADSLFATVVDRLSRPL